jgi:hypothetical protein
MVTSKVVSKATAAVKVLPWWWRNTVVPALLDDERQLDKLPSGMGSRWPCTQAGCVRGVRPFLAVVVLIIMAVWLPVDVWKLDGIVPGTKDTYMVEAKLVEDNATEIERCYTNFEAGTSEDCIYSCPCKIDTSGLNLLQDPFAYLQVAPVRDQEAFNAIIVRPLVSACKGTVFDLSTVDGRKTATQAYKYLWAAHRLRFRPLPGSLLLTRQAWLVSRSNDARSECSSTVSLAHSDVAYSRCDGGADVHDAAHVVQPSKS